MFLSKTKKIVFYYLGSEDPFNYDRIIDPFGLEYEFYHSTISTEKLEEVLKNIYDYDFKKYRRINVYLSKDNIEMLHLLKPYLMKHLSFTEIYECIDGKIIPSTIVYSHFQPTPKLCLTNKTRRSNE